jgi:hypothetical protein
VKTPQDAVSQIFHALGCCSVASQPNYFYHGQYYCVKQPLACAVDVMHGKHDMHIVYLQPPLVLLEYKLKTAEPTLTDAVHLVDAMLAGIAERFNAIF